MHAYRKSSSFKWVLLVTVPRTVLDDAANLEMGHANAAGAATDCVSQACPKEVSTDCVSQAGPKAVVVQDMVSPETRVR